MSPGPKAEAFEAALAALRRRERSVAEITAWLEGRDYPPDEVAAAVDRLIECGELDDERFAARFAEDKRELANWGPERIAAALRDRGLARSLVEAASAEGRDEQLRRATGILLGRKAQLDDDRDRERALGLLTRRGFGYELAHDAIRRAEALAEESAATAASGDPAGRPPRGVGA